jgi:hypothetical protein
MGHGRMRARSRHTAHLWLHKRRESGQRRGGFRGPSASWQSAGASDGTNSTSVHCKLVMAGCGKARKSIGADGDDMVTIEACRRCLTIAQTAAVCSKKTTTKAVGA